MKLWVDDIRPAPEGYVWKRSVYGAMHCIQLCEAKVRVLENESYRIELIDIDISYDSKVYTEITNWLKETGRDYEIKTHGGNSNG